MLHNKFIQKINVIKKMLDKKYFSKINKYCQNVRQIETISL